MATPAFNPSASYSIPSFDPNAEYQVAGSAPASTPQGTIGPMTERQRFLMNYPVGAKDETLGQNLYGMAQNAGVGVFQAVDAMAHPIRSIEGLADSLNPGSSTPNPVQQVYQGLQTNPGVVGPQMAGQALVADPMAEAGSEIAGRLGAGIKGGAGAVYDYARPSPSPAIVGDTEMAARNLAKAVLPATKDAQSFIKAAQQEMPNVIQYAKETGNPLKTQLEFSKAAAGHAQNVRNFYDSQILGPNDKVVSVAGSGYEGPTVGEGQNAPLSAIDKRLTAINDELSGSYSKMNVGDVRTSLASKGALQREAFNLRQILHKQLSDATGLTPSQIGDIRQQVGRSYELANDTDAAVTARMQSEGKGGMKEMNFYQLPGRIMENIEGGPTAIADRAFQNAIENYPGESTPLPQIQAPAPKISTRSPLWKDIQASRNSITP